MEKYLFPWESHVMIHYPWAMPLFLLALGILLSIISWIKRGNGDS